VWTRSGFLCSKKPRSVAGWWVVEIVRSIESPSGEQSMMDDPQPRRHAKCRARR
jgi:hypothetical protein